VELQITTIGGLRLRSVPPGLPQAPCQWRLPRSDTPRESTGSYYSMTSEWT